MKILIVTTKLTGIGGIESSLINLLSNINDMHDIDLCVLGNYISPKSEIPENVRIIKGSKIIEYIYLDYQDRKKDYNPIEKASIFFWKAYRRKFGVKPVLKKVLKRFKIPGEYDVAISFANDIYRKVGYMGGPEDAVLDCVNAKQKIAWIHNDATRLGFTHDNGFDHYSRFDKIVNVSYACKDIFDNIFPEFKDKSYVVYNMFDQGRIDRLSKEDNPFEETDVFRIVTVARLDNEQKRIDKVIDCCKMLKDNGITNFKWHVVGSGPDEEKICSMAEKKDVNDVVVFEGFQKNPYKYIKNSNLFVLPSDYESYGMVIREAQILGIPVVCSDFPVAKEIITDNYDGYIILNEVSRLFSIIKSIIENRHQLDELKVNIYNSDYGSGQAVEQFQNLLKC